MMYKDEFDVEILGYESVPWHVKAIDGPFAYQAYTFIAPACGDDLGLLKVIGNSNCLCTKCYGENSGNLRIL